MAVLCLPPAARDLEAAATLRTGVAPVAQDTTQIRRKKPIEERPRLRRRLPGDTAGLLPPDSLTGDSLAAEFDDGAPFPQPDSIMQALMQRPGYRPVIYRGDTLRFSAPKRSIRIHNRANIEEAGQALFASDSVVYERATNLVRAFGRSRLINANGEEVDSEEGPVIYHTGREIGTFVNARTQWEVWNVQGDFTLEGSDTLWVKGGHFTSCDLPEPHYRFESDKIKLILGHIVVAWPVRLYFGDVPVFWFPFIAQDIRRGRHSGILTPRFGVNDIVRNASGHDRHISNIGYYWAISDYMDAQIGLDWWSDNWTRLDGFYRYRWRQKFINGRLGYSQFFLPEGGRELSLAWNHSQKFGERSDLRASVRFVSSQQFQRENEFNPERLTQQIRSDVGYTRRFDWGTLNLSGQRVQPLSNPEEGRSQPTTMTLPQLSLTLAPIELTPAPSPLEASWYHGLTWTGSTNFSRTTSEVSGQPDQTSLNSGVTSNVSLSSLRWNSTGSYREETIDRPDTLISAPDTSIVGPDTTVTVDTLVLAPEVREGRLTWRTSLGYQQRLIGSTSLTPAVNLDGSLFRSNETDLDFVAAPTRVSVSARLGSDLYGFFPGVGPLQRIRHKFSPTFDWSYSPEVKPSAELEGLRGFNPSDVQEQHRVTFGLSQTFEGKLRPEAPPPSEAAGEDTVQERRPPEARKITLMAIRTTALTYDFVEGELTTDQISNTLTSDLLRGLTIRLEHDLFEELDGGDRRFDPFLTQLNLSFSFGDEALGRLIGQSRPGDVSSGRGLLPESREFDDLESEVPPEDEFETGGADAGIRRPWNINLDYSLVRPRPLPGQEEQATRQSLRANLGFKPTPNWTLTWRTQFDLEENDFVDHALSLRRDLHRWSATFQFLKASNGNFLFEFQVNLNDMRDIKFDYRQETRR